jgi:hypothetical protein
LQFAQAQANILLFLIKLTKDELMKAILNQRPKSLVYLKYLFFAIIAVSIAYMTMLGKETSAIFALIPRVGFIIYSLIIGSQLYLIYTARYHSRTLFTIFGWLLLISIAVCTPFIFKDMALTQSLTICAIAILMFVSLLLLYSPNVSTWVKRIEITNFGNIIENKNLTEILKTRPKSVLFGMILVGIAGVVSFVLMTLEKHIGFLSQFETLAMMIWGIYYILVILGLYKGRSIALFFTYTLPLFTCGIQWISIAIQSFYAAHHSMILSLLLPVLIFTIYLLLIKFTLYNKKSRDWFRLCYRIRKSERIQKIQAALASKAS